MAGAYEPYPGNIKKSGGSKTLIIVLVVVGVVALVGIVACLGGGYALFSFGTGQVEQQAMSKLQQSPAAREALGEIQSVSFNLATAGERPGLIVLEVTGSKNQGKVAAKQVPAGIELVDLKLNSGETIDLSAGAVAP